MADLGLTSLLLALIISICSAIAFVLGAGKGYIRLTASARKGVLAVCFFVSVAAYALYYALLTHDFSIEYVASHTSLGMPVLYNISAFWAGNAGSLLLWIWLLSIMAAVVVIRKQEKNEKLSAYFLTVIIGTLIFFLLLLILTANPFEKLSPTPANGIGLNPILENPGMVLHPPLLIAGFVAFTVPFALAIAALITKSQNSDWLHRIRRWTLLAWLLLGMGNIVGAWWAYVELGWGGYWAWDPVENAGLMPWLIGTAFLHSVTIQRRKGILKVWTIVLIIMAFNLCIFGTFLTRSGFLSSVHTFADTGTEYLFLSFLSITLVGPLVLTFSRRKYLRGEKREGSFISKENTFVLTNILFVAATLVIFLGTMYPWLSEKITDSTTILETSFFDKSVGPIFLLIILLLGICLLLGWRRTSLLNFIRKALYPLAISLLLCLVLYIAGIREWYALTLFPLCSFVAFSQLLNWYREVRARRLAKKENPLKAFFGLFLSNRPYYGGMIVHLGIVLIAIGIIGSSFYQSKVETGLQPGESVSINNYTLTFDEMTMTETPTKIIFRAGLSVHNGQNLVGKLEPEKYIQISSGNIASEVSIRSIPRWWLPLEDLYVILAGWTTDGTAIFQILVNPLVNLIWFGGVMLALGGILAFWPRKEKESGKPNDTYEREMAEIIVDTEPVIDLPVDLPLEPRNNAASKHNGAGGISSSI